MDDAGRYAWMIAIFLLLTLISMFFSSSEAAISILSESKLKRMADEDNAKAKAILKLKEGQADFGLWVDTSAILCVTVACFIGTYIFAPIFQNPLNQLFEKSEMATAIATALGFLVAVFIVFLFGFTLPKKVISKKSESFLFATIGLLIFLGYIFKPLTFVLLKTTNGVSRLFKTQLSKKSSDETEEEIRMLVDFGNENGTIEHSEREMINNIFEFDDLTAGDIMTHRTDIVAVEIQDDITDVILEAINEGFSRIPVYDDVIDNIVGIIYVKDLLSLIGNEESKHKKISDFMRGVIYAPESARCRGLFIELKEKKTHMAVIVDEYGGTAGIVTMEDLIEAIVGNIQDEYDQEEEEIKMLDANTYSLDGGIDLEDVEELFSVILDPEEEMDTLGGLIVNTLGRIPAEDETPTVVIGGVEFTVMLVEERRIIRVKATKLPEPEVLEE